MTYEEAESPYVRPASWFDELKRNVQETDVKCLDLSEKRLKIWEVTSILEFLADSQVSELDLSYNNFTNQMESLSMLLMRTKVTKLRVCACNLKTHDVLSLMKVLKETQITDLDVSHNSLSGSELFILYLLESHLTALKVGYRVPASRSRKALPFIQALQNTRCFLNNVFNREASPEAFLSLFSALKHTSITHLGLAYIGRYNFKRLGNSLRNSNLVALKLSNNDIQDGDVDDLFQVLAGSKITSLNLAHNSIAGDNNLSTFLKDTQITSLNLNGNRLKAPKMFSFPDFLRGSSVKSLKLKECLLSDAISVPIMTSLRFSKLTDLDVSATDLPLSSIEAFAEIVSYTSITNFKFSRNYRRLCRTKLAVCRILLLIGDLSQKSKFKHLDVSHGFWDVQDDLCVVAGFWEKLTNSPVTSLNMSGFAFDLGQSGAEVISPLLARTKLSHLNLTNNKIRQGIFSLAANLKFTVITHLNLALNRLADEGAKVLAECLEGTCITDLNLSSNYIRSSGAIALALVLKDTSVCNLKLDFNEIGNEGLEALAEHIKPGLITNVDVTGNCGNVFVVETVVWKNRKRVNQLVSSFKRIAPETSDKVFGFEVFTGATDIDSFLEECLSSYEMLTKQSSAAKILAREESITLSSDQIATVIFDAFPKQFAEFIAKSIEADISEQVNFLKGVEGRGLSKIVELLLLNRPVYTTDESHGVLHPYVYKLLMKYQLPICNLDVEPQGLEKIIKYFATFTDIEGAADVVSMLQTKIPS